MSTLDEDLPPASPAETLRVIEEQRLAASRKLQPHPMAFLGPWGIAWLIGFGLMFLRFGPGDRIFVPLPQWLPLTILFVLLMSAATLSGILAGRSSRGVRGRSSTQGAMYGIAWFVAFTGMGMTLARFHTGLPDVEVGLLYSTVAVGLTGALHMAGAAIWHDRTLFGLGVWLTVINIVGTALGPGWHSLVISVAGGGAMLMLGLILWLRAKKTGRPWRSDR